MKGNSTLAPGIAVILQTADPSPARRSALIASHPEIRRLGGPDRRTAWWCLALFAAQSGLAVLAGQVGWVTVLIAGYGFGPLLALAIGLFSLAVMLVLGRFLPKIPAVLVAVVLAIGAILGVASWFRGKAQADPMNPIPPTRG